MFHVRSGSIWWHPQDRHGPFHTLCTILLHILSLEIVLFTMNPMSLGFVGEKVLVIGPQLVARAHSHMPSPS